MNDRFLQQFAVNSLPTAAATKCSQQQNQAHNKDKRQGKQLATSKQATQDGNINSIEKYLTRSQPLTSSSNIDRKVDELLCPRYDEEPKSYHVEQLISNTIPTMLAGWN
jgi:hypothetical protein